MTDLTIELTHKKKKKKGIVKLHAKITDDTPPHKPEDAPKPEPVTKDVVKDVPKDNVSESKVFDKEKPAVDKDASKVSVDKPLEKPKPEPNAKDVAKDVPKDNVSDSKVSDKEKPAVENDASKVSVDTPTSAILPPNKSMVNNITPNRNKPDLTPLSFEKALLGIRRVRVKNLKSVETFGKNVSEDDELERESNDFSVPHCGVVLCDKACDED